MKLKTYRAHSMAEALAAVKADLGRDAVILHTRSVKSGGLLGFRRKSIIEITASDQAVPPRRRASAESSARAPVPQPGPARVSLAAAAKQYARQAAEEPSLWPSRDREGATADVGISRGPHFAPPLTAMSGSKSAENGPASPQEAMGPEAGGGGAEEADATLMRVRRRGEMGADHGSPDSNSTTHASSDDSLIRRELSDIKQLVSQVLRASPSSSASSGPSMLGCVPDALFNQYLRLLESQVSREIADRIVGAVRDELTSGELSDESIVRTTVLRHVASMIPVAEPTAIRESRKPRRSDTVGLNSGPTVIALVGPTGVGKTTTLAKLAATYKLRQGRSVALITSDTYRIAAVDQIRTYAGIIGLPLRVVLTPGEMGAAVDALSNHDVILVDTAGRSQHNSARIAELSEFLVAARPTETHLVLSSTAAPEVLFSAADAFAALKPNRVILTKLDEAVHFGVIVNVMQRLNSRLSFITTGQEVPDHIEPGRPERLARLVLESRDARLGAEQDHEPEASSQPAGVM